MWSHGSLVIPPYSDRAFIGAEVEYEGSVPLRLNKLAVVEAALDAELR